MRDLILVTGATGNTGSAVLRQLEERGANVRAMVRKPDAAARRTRQLGIGFTFLRPNLYFQGLLAFQPMIAKEGRFVAAASSPNLATRGRPTRLPGHQGCRTPRWLTPSRQPSGAMCRLSHATTHAPSFPSKRDNPQE